MSDLLALKKQVRDKVTEVVDAANLKYGISMSYPTVEFRNMGRKAGEAFYTDNHLGFNIAILAAQPEAFIDRTPGHEVAHLVAYKVHGPVDGRGHGWGWQQVMLDLGMNPARTHNYDVSVATSGHWYHCPSCNKEYFLSPEKSRRQSVSKRYTCNRHRNTFLIQGKAPEQKPSVNDMPAPIALTTRTLPQPLPVAPIPSRTGSPIDRRCNTCGAAAGRPCRATSSRPGQDPNRPVGIHKLR